MNDPLDPEFASEDILESDLDARASKWGESVPNPCLYFLITADNGIRPMDGPGIRACDEKLLATDSESNEVIEVDLVAQVVRVSRTDLYLPDSVPIAFRRVLRPGATNPTEFGVSGTYSYDKYLWAHDLHVIHVAEPEFVSVSLVRVPYWLPMDSVNKWVDDDYSGRFYTMTYHQVGGERYEIKDFHGNVETYLPCDGPIPCYLNGYRSAQGQTLRFERTGKNRRLVQLTSPNEKWLKLDYDAAERPISMHDSLGRTVKYIYNQHNQLIRVVHANGEVMTYEYDSGQRLLAVGMSPNETAASRELLRNSYDADGRLVKQVLDGSNTYTYVHHPVAAGQPRFITMTAADGYSANIYAARLRGTVWSAGKQ